MTRTRVFVYEHLTGGGLIDAEAVAPQSLLREGRAMVRALAADFADSGDVDVDLLADPRIVLNMAPGVVLHRVASAAERDEQFDRLAASSDWTVVIAPETRGVLLQLVERVLSVGGRLLGPAPRLVALASDKQALAHRLEQAGVQVPAGIVLDTLDRWPPIWDYPAVLKPRDGCGSQCVRLVDRRPDTTASARALCGAADESDERPPSDAPRGDLALRPAFGWRPPVGEPFAATPGGWGSTSHGRVPRGWLLEQFCDGLPASVALISGGEGTYALEPCQQRLSTDGHFVYLGGAIPLPNELAARARELALRAVDALEGQFGYLGVDLVLGAGAPDDVVIEVNPRLTTSYVGLRHAYQQNLARWMLDVAAARTGSLPAHVRPVRFDAEGTVWTG